MSKDRWAIVGRLKKAVKKITFLLNLNVNRWRIASMLGRSSTKRRHVSFNDRIGLRVAFPDDKMEVSPPSKTLSRTTSCPSSDDDVDKRAEMFIANFYRQLRMERQVSLELRYCRGNSLDSSSPS